ncbi:MAG: lytic transglycosylase domain-containing protein [Thiolinea sp.]
MLIFGCSHLQAGKASDYQPLIQQEASNSGVSAALISAVIQVESDFRANVVSPKGAQGLMQLMPATAQRFGVKDAFDPQQNIRGGSQYLLWLYRRYQNWPLVLAAYNAGEQKVDKYGGIPPYRETRNYVRKVLQHYAKLSGKPVSPREFGQGRVVQAVLRSAGKPQATAVSAQPEVKSLEAIARGSSVFFAE